MQQLPVETIDRPLKKAQENMARLASVVLENVEDEDGATRIIIRGGLQQTLGEGGV